MRKTLLAVYIVSISIIGVGLLWQAARQPLPFGTIITFILITMLAEALPVDTPLPGTTVSASFGLVYASLLILGPGGAAMVAAFGTLSLRDLAQKAWYRNLFNMSQLALATYLAGWVYLHLGGQPGMPIFPGSTWALLAALLLHFLLNSTFPTLAASLASGMPWFKVWQRTILWAVPSFLALGPLGVLLAFVYQGMGFLAILLFMVPLLVARHSFQLYRQMRQTYVETVQTLAQAIEAKDHYTRGHSERVAIYATAIARRLNLPESQVDLIYFLSLLHDVGKIGVREQVLNKQGS